jgi:hypothetical protein
MPSSLKLSGVFVMFKDAPWWEFHKRECDLRFALSEIQNIEVLEVDDPVAALASAAPQPTPARVGALQQQNQIDLESVHPLVGKRFSLLTRAGARYEGRLFDVASFPITCIAYFPLFKPSLAPFAFAHLLNRIRTNHRQ